ncbi:MAG: phenylalanine--tRNA ligase subunit beta, partial [Clostridiales Family XIII bacterium]|nr:phenylalanine--tRNA ligase subunit beta [Clostridiales Family XIII bacterium]
MIVPISFLKKFIEVEVDIKTFSEKMIIAGSNIERIEEFGIGIENVVLGKILEIKKHENSDHLVICHVDIGKEKPLQIVTGAENLFVGAYIPTAIAPSKLPGGKIRKTIMRGEESNGMLCASEELGFSNSVTPLNSHNGIWILNDDEKNWEENLGKDIVELLELEDYIIDFEITPNRPDCLSIIGIAREAAATFSIKMIDDRLKTVAKSEGINLKKNSDLEISIENSELCSRYTGRIIRDIKITESPFWLKKLLMLSGVRPINNIVDITNFVMLETGNPIHAFDLRTIEGNKIIIKKADDIKSFTTLDGQKRELNPEILLINDAVKPLAIAGVMGGLNSEIKDDTKDILIEVASFNSDSIRLTSKFLGLKTEASNRYEKGISPYMAKIASDRVTELVLKLAKGKADDLLDNFARKVEDIKIELRIKRANEILGINLSKNEIIKILERLDITATKITVEKIEVNIPFYRLDLKSEIDLIEEIARIYGYDNIGKTVPKGNAISEISYHKKIENLIKESLLTLGVTEMMTFSFVSPSYFSKINLDKEEEIKKAIKLL